MRDLVLRSAIAALVLITASVAVLGSIRHQPAGVRVVRAAPTVDVARIAP
ncbi:MULTISPECIES: hypothetical protein [unclassified Bradyrhizobium]|nr:MULTISPECIES: hypothetical protein [unclassified Bradyrhizobium]